MIDLFRPYIDTEAALASLRDVLTPDQDGRLYIGEGRRVVELERRFGALIGADPDNLPLATNCCTSALALAVYLAGRHPSFGEVIISTPLTCTATSSAIRQQGCRILWADVDPVTGLIDPDDVARKYARTVAQGSEVRAVMAVDWAGRVCDYAAIRQAVGAYVPIIRDAAHALLAEGPGLDQVDFHCYSAGPIKHLSSPDGGFLVTRPEVRRRARLNRWFGLDRESSADFRCSQTVTEHGFKFHQNDVIASILLANLDHARALVERCRENAAWYDRVLRGLPGVTLPPPDRGCSYWLYYLTVDDRDGLMQALAARGVASSPVHTRNDTQPAYHYPSGPLPGVDAIGARGLAIPNGYWIGPAEREQVAAAVISWATEAKVAA